MSTVETNSSREQIAPAADTQLSADERREYQIDCDIIGKTVKELGEAEKLKKDVERKIEEYHFELGCRLHNINKKRLYREEYGSWESFVLEKCEFEVRRAYQLIAYHELSLILTKGEPLGLSESEARPLTRMLKFEDDLRELWKDISDDPKSYDISQEATERLRGIQEEQNKEKAVKAAADNKRAREAKRRTKAAEEAEGDRKEREAEAAERAKYQAALDSEVAQKLEELPEAERTEEVKAQIAEKITFEAERVGDIESLVDPVCSLRFKPDIPEEFDVDRDFRYDGQPFHERVAHWLGYALSQLDAEIAHEVADFESRLEADEEDDDEEKDEDALDEDEEEQDEETSLDDDEEAESEVEIENEISRVTKRRK